jgi:hypothetical protein
MFTILWLIFWATIGHATPVWTQHNSVFGSVQGLTVWGLAGAICLAVDLFVDRGVIKRL